MNAHVYVPRGGWTQRAAGLIPAGTSPAAHSVGSVFAASSITSRMLAAFALSAAILGADVSAFAQQGAPDNIVVVLDASGSMRQRMAGSRLTRMEAAKQALLKVMQQVTETTQVGLLVFSSQNLKTDWAYPLGPLDRPKLEAAIKRPEPGGGTPLGEYLKKGADALLTQREKQRGYGTFRLLVVTDGEATDQPLVDRYLPDVLTRGITVDVIGVDMKSDLALATRVHAYRRANNPKELTEAVSSAFAEIGSSKKDDIGTDAFAALEAIPDDVAKAMLGALATSGNHPIGERPPAPATAPTENASTPARAAPPPVRAPAAPSKNSGGGGWMMFLIVVVLGVVWVVIKAQQQQRRGRP